MNSPSPAPLGGGGRISLCQNVGNGAALPCTWAPSAPPCGPPEGLIKCTLIRLFGFQLPRRAFWAARLFHLRAWSRKVGTGFRKRPCSTNNAERDDGSK